MSRYKPKSLLSVLFNTMVAPAYRLEYHLDLDATVARFELNDARKGGPLRDALIRMDRGMFLIRDNADDVEARRPRRDLAAREKHTKGLRDVQASSAIVFERLAAELETTVMSGAWQTLSLARELDPLAPVNGPANGFGPVEIVQSGNGSGGPDIGPHQRQADVVVKPNGLLLEYLYYFFHFPVTRDEILKNIHFIAAAVNANQSASKPDDKEVCGAVGLLDEQLRQPTRDPAIVAQAVQTLCTAMKTEYDERGSLCVW